MKKPFVLIAAIVAVVGLGMAVAVAKETTNVGTSVKLEFRHGGPLHPPAFLGRVKAARNSCQNGRRVIVTRRSEIGLGKVGVDTSNNRGKYKIIVASHDLPRWGYSARAWEKTITRHNGDKILCKRSWSKPKRVAVP